MGGFSFSPSSLIFLNVMLGLPHGQALQAVCPYFLPSPLEKL